MTQEVAELLNIFITIIALVIGWLIKTAISNFKGSVDRLDKTLKDLDRTVQDHNHRISKVEWQLEKKND